MRERGPVLKLWNEALEKRFEIGNPPVPIRCKMHSFAAAEVCVCVSPTEFIVPNNRSRSPRSGAPIAPRLALRRSGSRSAGDCMRWRNIFRCPFISTPRSVSRLRRLRATASFPSTGETSRKCTAPGTRARTSGASDSSRCLRSRMPLGSLSEGVYRNPSGAGARVRFRR